MTVRGCTPRNDQRPKRCPRSADSSRNDGPSPRRRRYAETGVSVSLMKVWRSGTTVWPSASARTSSRLGLTSSSAATGIELLEGVRERHAARGKQNGEVVEHVGRLLAHALVRLGRRRARHLLRLLLHLLADPRRVGQQLGGVAAGGRHRSPLGDRALEHRERLGRRGLEVAVVEAAAFARVTGGAGGLDERDERVGVAVVAQRLNALHVSRGLALVPELLPRAAPEPG